MNKSFLFLAVALLVCGPIFAQPSISGLQNNYSYILPAMPNYGIAQGSIFVMYGSNMGPSQIASQSTPLQRTLGGVAVNITGSDGKTYQAIPYYVSAAQIAAILPSATPVGNGTITVTYNGQTSKTAPIKVVKSAFGMLTMNNAGSGPAAAFDAQYKFLGVTNSANANEVVTLWGTGLGPATGDETQLGGTAGDLGSAVPVQVWIGGKSATVQYHGRSQYPGLDQLNAFVPQGVSGCYVSVVVQSGNVVSNFGTIPVAAAGRTCSDSTGMSAGDLEELLGKGTFSIGGLILSKTTSQTPDMSYGGVTIPGKTTKSDHASGSFAQYTAAQFNGLVGLYNQASIGSCLVTTYTASSISDIPDFTLNVKALDAGSAISLTMPSGNSMSMPRGKAGMTYSLSSSGQPGDPPSFIPDSGGKFTFDNGSGGPDVGHFNTSVTISAPLVWTNMDKVGPNISLSQPLTVTWSGGDPSGYVVISGMSAAISGSNVAGVTSFTCTAPQSAGQFTVPQAVLLSLPAGATIGGMSVPIGSLSLSNHSTPQKFSAPGVDVAYVESYTSSSKTVNYTAP